MNFKMIRYTLGWILLFEAGFLLVPLATAIVYTVMGTNAPELYNTEWWPMWSILISMGICFAIGFLFVFKKPKNTALYARDGLVIVALSWIILSAFGAIPFVISGAIPNYIDAFFETASGFSTTGSSIINGVESLPKSMLMWRSFTHWVGGMGVLVFLMAFLPLGGAQNLHIMRAESPGPTVSKLVPKMKTTALILYVIYFILTLVMFIILLFDPGNEHGKMSVFEALNTAFATAGTGGFGFRNDSFASFSSFAQIVVTVFMLIFSINFNSYYLLGKRRIKEALNLEVVTFLIIVAVAICAIALNIYFADFSEADIAALQGVKNSSGVVTSDIGENGKYTLADSFKHASFTVATIISTSGFGTENFVAWPELSQVLIVLLMFIGACAGSTGGGIKVSRILILVKGVVRELRAAINPRRVQKITIDKRPVENEVVRSVNAYIVCYIVVFIVALVLISLDPFVNDLTTAFTSVAATINNIGPGLGDVGPASNFSGFNWFSKLVLSFNMLAGRLELLPMLLLFAPSTWKK